jgi:hypothetical protein
MTIPTCRTLTPSARWGRPGLLSLCLAAALTPARAGDVRIVGPTQPLEPGEIWTFRVEADPSGDSKHGPGQEPSSWEWTLIDGPGILEPTTGMFVANPNLPQQHQVVVSVTDRHDPRRSNVCQFWVAPAAPPQLAPLQPPFRSPIDGQRPANPRALILHESASTKPLNFLMGYGVPSRWVLQSPSRDRWSRRLVHYMPTPGRTGWWATPLKGNDLELCIQGRDSTGWVESLLKVPGPDNIWRSVRLPITLTVRGMAQVAGVPDQPGCALGFGSAARFMRIGGLAALETKADLGEPGRSIAVADMDAHVVRLVSQAGMVQELCGKAEARGHQDGKGETANPYPRETVPLLLVADTGNQVIKETHRDREVRVLAGQRQAQPVARDGVGDKASFVRPTALAAGPTGLLFVADGAAVRCLNLHSREVTTLAGIPSQEGFQEVSAAVEDREAELRKPCFRAIGGIQWDPVEEVLYVADSGNHALRKFWPAQHLLGTLAGDPAKGQTRFGLLRDCMTVELSPAYANLRAPRVPVLIRDRLGLSLMVNSGHCLAEISCRDEIRDQFGMELPVALPPERPGEEAEVQVIAHATDPDGDASSLGCHLQLDVHGPDGVPAAYLTRPGVTGEPMAIRFPVPAAGTYRIVARCISSQGLSVGTEMVMVVPEAAESKGDAKASGRSDAKAGAAAANRPGGAAAPGKGLKRDREVEPAARTGGPGPAAGASDDQPVLKRSRAEANRGPAPAGPSSAAPDDHFIDWNTTGGVADMQLDHDTAPS